MAHLAPFVTGKVRERPASSLEPEGKRRKTSDSEPEVLQHVLPDAREEPKESSEVNERKEPDDTTELIENQEPSEPDETTGSAELTGTDSSSSSSSSSSLSSKPSDVPEAGSAEDAMKKGELEALDQFKHKHRVQQFMGISDELMNEIKFDEETAYSLTSSRAANAMCEHIESVMPDIHVVIDATAGAGLGNLWSFSKNFKDADVHGIELDPERFKLLEHNKRVLRMNNVRCHKGSCLDIIPRIDREHRGLNKRTTVIFFDPFWGGPGYMENGLMDLSLDGKDLSVIVNDFCRYASLIALKVPMNFDFDKFHRNLSNLTHDVRCCREIDSRIHRQMFIVIIDKFLHRPRHAFRSSSSSHHSSSHQSSSSSNRYSSVPPSSSSYSSSPRPRSGSGNGSGSRNDGYGRERR